MKKATDDTKGIKVETAFLHQALQAPGVPAERTISATKIVGLKMIKLGDSIYMQCTVNGKPKITAIPMTNVANWNPSDDLSELFA